MEMAIDYARHHHNIQFAATMFNVPKSTLHDRLRGKTKGTAKAGHPTVLTPKEEEEIVETCSIFVEWGVGLGRREVERVVQSYLKTTKRKNPFKDGAPGERRRSGFLK